MLVVRIAGILRLVELKPQIAKLRSAVDDGGLFHKFYLRYIDTALEELDG